MSSVWIRYAVRVALALACLADLGLAQNAPAPDATPRPPGVESEAENPAPQGAMEEGLLPIPDFTGDFWSRRYLTGDWGGVRSDLARMGIQFDLQWVQHVQGVVSGGRDTDTRYLGNLDYLFNIDLMRMGVIPGGLLKIRAESRYGDSVNGIAGSILPANTDAFFPLTESLDDDIAVTVTSLSYTQFLAPTFAIFAGKMDTLDGDANEFASGRGTSQFLNANFIFNAALALRLPYSTLGAGMFWQPAKWVSLTSSIINTVDSSTRTGFDDFGDGLTWSTEAQFQYKLGSLPGGQNVGFVYSFDQEFARLTGRLVFQPGEGLVFPDEDETWAVYWSTWQYLWTEERPGAPINLGNGVPDQQGIGLFARFGFADGDTNPVDWSASLGIGGRGIIPTRDNDTFGIGYFYTSLNDNLFSTIFNTRDHSSGLEAYYVIAITPAAHLTLDAQFVDGISSNLDSSVVLGVRLVLRF